VPERAGRPRAGHLCAAEIQDRANPESPCASTSSSPKPAEGFAPSPAIPAGSKLPQHHGPWTAVGVVRPEAEPPHRFSRVPIERAIDGDGFQLWRLSANGTPA
jgi:hypothetical protein